MPKRKFLLKFRKRDKNAPFFQEVYHGIEAKDLRRIKSEPKNIPNLEDKKSDFYKVSDDFCEQLVSFLNVSKDLIMVDSILRDGIPISRIKETIEGHSTLLKTYPKAEVYECEEEIWPQIMMSYRDRRQRVALSQNLPGIILSGAIAQYDNMLQILIKEVLKIQPDLALSFERKLTLKELQNFSTMDDAREYLTDKYVESFTRESHFEQIKKMETFFSIKLREDLPSLKTFLEVCQRRHCIIHSGGLVTQSYIEKLREQDIKCKFKVGEKLPIDAEYFEKALEVIFEIGFKLIQVLWRKYAPEDNTLSDHEIINQPLYLIQIEQYNLAIEILSFAKKWIKNWSSDQNSLICHVNLANATKLNGNQERANKILDEIEWSSRSPNFQICVAAVKDDVEQCLNLLKKYKSSSEINLTTILHWPVFYKIKDIKEFQSGCESIFGNSIWSSDEEQDEEATEKNNESDSQVISGKFG